MANIIQTALTCIATTPSSMAPLIPHLVCIYVKSLLHLPSSSTSLLTCWNLSCKSTSSLFFSLLGKFSIFLNFLRSIMDVYSRTDWPSHSEIADLLGPSAKKIMALKLGTTSGSIELMDALIEDWLLESMVPLAVAKDFVVMLLNLVWISTTTEKFWRHLNKTTDLRD